MIIVPPTSTFLDQDTNITIKVFRNIWSFLDAVEGPGVGVDDDLGEAGDDEAEVGAGVLGEEDGGLLPDEALGGETGGVEDVPDVGQPPAGAQPGEPLVA